MTIRKIEREKGRDAGESRGERGQRVEERKCVWKNESILNGLILLVWEINIGFKASGRIISHAGSKKISTF